MKCDNRTCKGPDDSDGGQAEVLHANVMAAAAVSRVGGVAVSVQHRSLKVRSGRTHAQTLKLAEADEKANANLRVVSLEVHVSR